MDSNSGGNGSSSGNPAGGTGKLPMQISDDSSISGPIDVEENISNLDKFQKIIEFSAHSNKTILEQNSIRAEGS